MWLDLPLHDRWPRHDPGPLLHCDCRRRPQQPDRGRISRQGRAALPRAGGQGGRGRRLRHRGADPAGVPPRHLRLGPCRAAGLADAAQRRTASRGLRARLLLPRDRGAHAVPGRQLPDAMAQRRAHVPRSSKSSPARRCCLPAHDGRVRRDQAGVRCGVLHAGGFGKPLAERLGEHPDGRKWQRRIAMSAWEIIRDSFDGRALPRLHAPDGDAHRGAAGAADVGLVRLVALLRPPALQLVRAEGRVGRTDRGADAADRNSTAARR